MSKIFRTPSSRQNELIVPMSNHVTNCSSYPNAPHIMIFYFLSSTLFIEHDLRYNSLDSLDNDIQPVSSNRGHTFKYV